MESGRFRLFAIVWGMVAVLAGILLAFPAHAAFFQKRFVVCQDRGRDILCDPYVVQKNDYVIKLFKQRGEIAHEDFPQFLAIFKRINSDVEDVNKIYPNQKILIPLKILAPGAIEGQSTGTVTIPIINITNLPDSMIQNSSRYEVQSGDTVSRLIAEQFGKLNRKEYDRVLELFKYMNPDVEDVNLIRVGKKSGCRTRQYEMPAGMMPYSTNPAKLIVKSRLRRLSRSRRPPNPSRNRRLRITHRS